MIERFGNILLSIDQQTFQYPQRWWVWTPSSSSWPTWAVLLLATQLSRHDKTIIRGAYILDNAHLIWNLGHVYELLTQHFYQSPDLHVKIASSSVTSRHRWCWPIIFKYYNDVKPKSDWSTSPKYSLSTTALNKDNIKSPVMGEHCPGCKISPSQSRRGSEPWPSRPSGADSAHSGRCVCTCPSRALQPRKNHPLPYRSWGQHRQRSLHPDKSSSPALDQHTSALGKGWAPPLEGPCAQTIWGKNKVINSHT